ncbi:MFS transporter [Saccharothrix syringae]|uniref:MFS transporter n=1 Tax=Saccharothrix syringae TaxID=103733 RepID=A0A5Q0H208_SACSY|nr:MFS transporter [Saccharothrix syringae]QFZ19945.1 MFS transporter [Saccharothrix syringae]
MNPVVLLACVAGFLTALDNNVLMVALPTIGDDLGLTTHDLQWAVVGYMLVFASLMVAAGAAGDRFGPRRVLLAGLLGFAVASLGCGTAGSGWELSLWRAVQGAGAAAIVPTGLAVLRTGLDERGRRAGIAAWTAALAVALAVGPALGGLLAEAAHWRWIFLGNVPVCAAAALLAHRVLPDRRGAAPLPVRSTLALTAAVFAVTAAVLGVGLALVPAVVACLVFRRVERSAAHPLFPPGVVRGPFAAGVAAQALWGLAVSGALFVLPLHLHRAEGFTPLGTGLFFVPAALAVVAGAPAVPLLVARFGAARTAGAGLVAVTAGLAVLPVVPVPGVLACLVLVGLGSALTTPLTTTALDAADERLAGVASAAVTASRELAGALGVALVGLAFTAAGLAAAVWVAAAATALALPLSRSGRCRGTRRSPGPAPVPGTGTARSGRRRRRTA